MSRPPDADRSMTTVERAIALRGVESFGSVPVGQLAHLAAVSREEWWPEGHVYCREGDPPGGLAVLVSGAAELRHGAEVIGRVDAGEAIGAWSIFDDQPRLADVIVVRSCRALVISRDDLFDVLSDHFDIARYLMRDLIRRLRGLTQT